MALQVWLPLNGDLNNQGIEDINIINNGATVNTSGKIGNCYSFNGSNNYLYTSYNFYNSIYSVSAWIYTTSASATQTIVCDRTTVGCGFSIFLIGGKLRIDPGGTSVQWTTSYTYPTNTWWHLAITYDGTKVAYYINGEFKQEYSTTLTQSYWGNIVSIGASQAQGSNYSNYLNGRLNDIRIYNNVLSLKEIKELSQGLILHYKLDALEPNGFIQDSSGHGYFGIITGSISTANNSSRYSHSIYISSGNTNYITTPALQLPGDAITINFWFKSSNTSPGSSYHMPFEGVASSNQSYEMSIHSNGYLRGGLVVGGTRKVDNCTSKKLIDGNWHMCSMTYDGTIIKRYVDGVMEKSTSATGTLITSTSFIIGHYGSNTSYYCKEAYVSDIRVYATALTENDITELYEVSASIDNKQNFYAYEFIENTSNQELLAQWNSNGYSNHTNTGKWSSYNAEGEWYLHGASTSLGTTFIPVSPTGKTYYYDMTLSVSAGNQAYVGISRFDANKGSASNEGCVYIYSTKPTSDIIKQRFFGTVNLGTTANGSNPLAYVTLRVLNGWSGSTDAANAEMTIHNISLREVDTATGITTASIIKTGVASSDSIREYDENARITKNGFIEANELIEI